MNRLRFLFAVVVLAAFAGCKSSPADSAKAVCQPKTAQTTACSRPDEAKAASEAAERAWSSVPEILARIVPPTFPARDFVITNYGAVGDGVADCTQAFADAIAACNEAGGGKVVVPPGEFLTGAIHLKSNVNLHVAKDATIRFSTNTAKFLPVVFTRFECTEVMNYSPFIYALGQENIAITGEGTLDGQASRSVWYTWKTPASGRELVEMGDKGVPVEQRVFGEGRELRPNFIQPVRCRNVLIEGVRVIDSPMWVLHPLYCTNVTIRGVTVDAHGPNNDGCDPDSCTDVWIKNCNFNTGDDCIAIKSGRDADGRRVNIPCENIVIQDCVFQDGHGGVTCGSETAGGIRNVFAENCSFNSTNLDMAIRFKTGMTRGGYIENAYVRNGTIQKSRTGIHMTMRYSRTGHGSTPPIVRNIDIRDCTFKELLDRPIVVEGFSPAVQITDVTIANCDFQSARRNSIITNASRVHLFGLQGARLE